MGEGEEGGGDGRGGDPAPAAMAYRFDDRGEEERQHDERRALGHGRAVVGVEQAVGSEGIGRGSDERRPPVPGPTPNDEEHGGGGERTVDHEPQLPGVGRWEAGELERHREIEAHRTVEQGQRHADPHVVEPTRESSPAAIALRKLQVPQRCGSASCPRGRPGVSRR